MRATPQRDTPPEISLRSALHRLGLRYRIHRPIEGVPRVRPDIVFVSARVVVFVDGCFWHRCPEHGTMPKANRDWWEAKLSANAARDRRHSAVLEGAGWAVIRFWEHEDPADAALRIAKLLAQRR
jgi:DNA mismatch endonuclease (patch repair protein)